VLLACWHRVIARLCPELPLVQREALNDQVKVPLVYATVLLSNWRAWAKAGIGEIATPGGFWQDVGLDFPVSIGRLRFARHPDEPILLHLGKVFAGRPGAPAREQAAAGRAQLMRLRFDDFEREIRSLLQGALGGFGF
jgi:spermidine dehydrogenase